MFRAFTFSLILISVLSATTTVSASASEVNGLSAPEAKPNSLLRKSYEQMIDGSYRDAVDTQILAVKADKDNVNARRYLTYSLLKIGASDEAIDQLHYLLSMTKALPIDMCMCGEALLQSGKLRQAEAWFKEALSADPKMTSAQVGLNNVAAAKKRRPAPVVEIATNPDENSTENTSEPPKTTYEQGVLSSSELQGVSTPSVGQRFASTQSLATETAQRLRGDQQQVASAVQPAKPNVGNNQLHNAWDGFRGVQKR